VGGWEGRGTLMINDYKRTAESGSNGEMLKITGLTYISAK
jgi:hypothetical protein